MRRDLQAIIDSERAEIGRWFGASPFGMLFFAEDGRGWPVPAETVERRKDEAETRLLTLLSEPMAERVAGIAAIGAAMVLVFLIGRASAGTATAYTATIMTGMGAAHAMQTWRLWRYRQSMRALRRDIAAELVRSAPLGSEIVTRYRRHNPWRLALHIWVSMILIAAALGSHFLMADPRAVLGVAAAVGVAWLLYWAANAVDARQRDSRPVS